MSDTQLDMVGEIQKAAKVAVEHLEPNLKKSITESVNDSLSDYAKNEELGTLRAKMLELQDKVDKSEAEKEAFKKTVSDEPVSLNDMLFNKMVGMVKTAQKTKQTQEFFTVEKVENWDDQEKAFEKTIHDAYMAQATKATSLSGSGLNLGAPRPVLDTFALMRAPSGIAQGFTETIVGSANLVIPTLVSSDGSDFGRPTHGFARGYVYTFDQGNQTVMERTVNWVRVQGSTPVGEDVLSDNPTMLQVFQNDLMAGAARFRANMLANDDGTGTGNSQQVRGLFNITAVPSADNPAVNPGTGVVTIDRVSFPGATLGAALAGGQVQDPNPAAGTAKTLTGANATYQTLISAYYSLEPQYRDDLVWVLSSQAVQQLRSLVDAYGRPLFTETKMMNEPAALGYFYGIPVYEDRYAPSFVASTRVRFGVLGSRSRFFSIYTRMMPELTVTPITNLGFSTFFVRFRFNTLVRDWLAGVALEFVGS